jgi:hypothetical protein
MPGPIQHYNTEGRNWRAVYDHPRRGRVMLDYKVMPKNRVKVTNDWGLGSGAIKDRLIDAVHEHHGTSGMHTDARPKKPEKVRYYHGTNVEGITHVLPASMHGRGTSFAGHTTDTDHAYASTSLIAAHHYAEHAADQHGGSPHVYEVKPIGHLEEDPMFDGGGYNRGNWIGDHRSRDGFKVIRELDHHHDEDEDEDYQ